MDTREKAKQEKGGIQKMMFDNGGGGGGGGGGDLEGVFVGGGGGTHGIKGVQTWLSLIG